MATQWRRAATAGPSAQAVSCNTVAPGGNGQAFGSGFFLQGNGTVTFAPGAGQTATVSDVIADQSGSGGNVANGTAGSWGLTKSGAGTIAVGQCRQQLYRRHHP